MADFRVVSLTVTDIVRGMTALRKSKKGIKIPECDVITNTLHFAHEKFDMYVKGVPKSSRKERT